MSRSLCLQDAVSFSLSLTYSLTTTSHLHPQALINMEFIGHHLCPNFTSLSSNVSGASSYNGTIVIIGAGVAGLSAACSLKKMGIPLSSIVILEASNHVGGRLKATTPHTILSSHGNAGTPLDLGAEWIHSVKGDKVLQSIMQDLVDEHDDKKDVVVPKLIPYSPAMYFNNKKSRLMSWLYKETKFYDTTWYHWMLSNLYERVKDCVVLNSPVSKVEYNMKDDNGDNTEVTLTLNDGTTRVANRLICTASLAVLKANIIEFVPTLPQEIQNALQSIKMPPGVRVLMQMKQKFYKDVNYCGTIFDLVKNGDDLAIIYDPLLGKGLDNQHVCAFVAIGNKNAKELCQLTDDKLAKVVLERIDEVYNGMGSENIIGEPIVQNWKAEEYIRGAYTFPAPSKLRKVLSMPIGNHIFLAGEHTSPKHSSLVPGAAREGRRAALDVLSSLNLNK